MFSAAPKTFCPAASAFEGVKRRAVSTPKRVERAAVALRPGLASASQESKAFEE